MNRLRAVFLSPAAALYALLLAFPLGILAVYSFQTRGTYGGAGLPWTVENWVRLADPLYLQILGKSFVIAAVSTSLCLLFGFPMALFLTRAGRWKTLGLQMVMLPFWTSFLIRTYAWMFLLRDTGLINSLLMSLGLIQTPIPLLYNDGAVILGLVYSFLPFAVLPIFVSLEKLDPAIVEAASDLGATPWQCVRRVMLPLSLPGIRAAGILVFIPCLGAYLTPDLLGGGKTILAGTLIQSQFTTARDWPFGSAVSLLLMLMVLGLGVLLWRRDKESLL